MARSDLFNPRKRTRLLRTYISGTENAITLLLLLSLAGIIYWVTAQKHNYNPMNRDVSIELLHNSPSGPKLYIPPLQRWTEPGTAVASQAVDIGIFPASLLDTEWQAKIRVREFNADNLFEKINGEAPKFLKQGFQAMYYLVLKSSASSTTDAELAIELYDQNDVGGSLGIFSDHVTTDTAIEQHDSVSYFRTSIGAIGRMGKYFFRIAGDAQTDAVRDKAVQVSQAFAQLAEDNDSDSEPEFTLLQNALAVPAELISFQAQNVFQYDFAEAFWFGKYAQENSERVFVHLAKDTEAAHQLYDLLLEEQSYEYETRAESEQQMLFYHEFLNNYFALAIRGNILYGIENAADEQRVNDIMQHFAEALVNEK